MKSIKWHNDAGDLIACVEKIKAMEQNLLELSALAQDILDDGVLMDISETQIKHIMQQLIHNLNSTYKDK